ncbi:unnamed protein product [Cuscuta campestris]|uniref:DUF4219 domain-containing protein n=1 Tax=Cuscuta campestris TaxID=132261 RepID=A0A484LSX8_9ASTE|nr:unnamed protein product [Cuscuta campestris]
MSYAELSEGHSTVRPPLFDGTNYTYWKERMRIYIRSINFQLWLIIKNGETMPMKKVGATTIPKKEEEYDAEDIKKVEAFEKAKHVIFCAINPDDYRKISSCSTAKEMWDKLEVTYEGYDDWKIMMEAHLYALHDCMWMVLEDGPLKIQMENLERNPATPDVVQYIPKPKKKWDDRDCKKHNLDNVAKAAIFKTLDPITFSKIKHLKTAMEIWQGLGKLCEGSEDLRKQKIEVLLEKFKGFKMLPGESFDMLDERFHKILNDLASLNHVLSPKEKNVRLLRSLPTKWYTKAAAMEEGRNLENYVVQGLLDELRTYEHELKKKKKEEQVTPFPTALMITPKVPSSEGTCPRNCDTPSSSQPPSTKMENYDEEFAMMVKQFRKFKMFFKKVDSIRRPTKGKPQVEKYGERERNEKKKKAMVAAESDESSSSSSDEEALVCMERRVEKSNHEDKWTMSEDDTLCLMAKDDADQEVTSQTSCSSSYESIPTSENLFDQFKKMMEDFEEINLKHLSLTEENKLLSEENLKLTEGRKSQLNEITQLKTENESFSEKVKFLNKELGILKSKEAVDKLLETTKHKGREGLGFDPSSSKRKGRTTFIPPKPTAKPNKQKRKEKEKPTEVSKKVVPPKNYRKLDRPQRGNNFRRKPSNPYYTRGYTHYGVDRSFPRNSEWRPMPRYSHPPPQKLFVPPKYAYNRHRTHYAQPRQNYRSYQPRFARRKQEIAPPARRKFYAYNYDYNPNKFRAARKIPCNFKLDVVGANVHFQKLEVKCSSPTFFQSYLEMIAAQELSEFLQMEIRLKFEEEVLEFYRNGEVKTAHSKKNPQRTFPVIKSTVGGTKVKLSQKKLGEKLRLPNSGVEIGKFPAKNLDWNIIGISGQIPSGPAKKADLNNDYKLVLELVIACLECGSGVKGKKCEARFWLYYLSSKGENRASASATAEESSSDNVPLIHMAKTAKRKQVVSPSISIEAPQNLALVSVEEAEEVSVQGELQRKKRKLSSPSTSEYVNSDKLKEKEPAEETSAQNRSPQQLEEEIPQVQSLPTPSPQPQMDDADNQFWQLYYDWRAWKVGNSTEQLMDWDQQLKNEKIIKKCLGIPVNHSCEEILDDYWAWQRNHEDLHLEYLANSPNSEFEVDDEDPSVYKQVFSKTTEEQVVLTSEAQAVLEATAEDFQTFTETSSAFETEISHASEMVLTEAVKEKATSPPLEQNHKTEEEEEFQQLGQSQVFEILTIACEISNPTEIEIPEKSAKIPEQSALQETMEQAVEAQRNSGEAEKETQMAELEVSQTPVAIFEEQNAAEERDSLSRDISDFVLDEAEGESERTLKMSLLQMDIRSALAVASANQVVTKDYLKVIIENQKEAYKLFRLIGANSGNRKMEVILQQHSPSPIPQLPIAVKEGEASYIPYHLSMTNLILEAQQRNPENSAQHLSSSGLDGTEFIGTVVDHFSNDAQSEERRENLRRIKELCGNMKGISERIHSGGMKFRGNLTSFRLISVFGYELLMSSKQRKSDISVLVLKLEISDSGIPCSHAIACILDNNEDPDLYTDKQYLVSNYLQLYINPVNMMEMWPKDEDGPLVIPPTDPAKKKGKNRGQGGNSQKKLREEMTGKMCSLDYILMCLHLEQSARHSQSTPDGHCVSVESDDGEWDIPRAHKKKKGKTLRPETSRDSSFERLGDREDGQRKSVRLRLGQSVAHVSAFAQLCEGREAKPTRIQRTQSKRPKLVKSMVSRQEEEAESQPCEPMRNRLTIPRDRVQQMEVKLERLEKKVGEKNDQEKPLAGSPFTTRVHLTPFAWKVKVDAPRFTEKEDP